MDIVKLVGLAERPKAETEQAWVYWAINQIEADFARSSDTDLIKLQLRRLATSGIDLCLKDESTHPSDRLKHRLA